MVAGFFKTIIHDHIKTAGSCNYKLLTCFQSMSSPRFTPGNII